ncbi:MAG: CinA family protein [Bacilli bacterium]
MENLRKLVQILTENGKTISSMESCTGGGFANAITNIEGASEVLKFSAVTYSNEFKIKMGVPKEIIDKYTVYSNETARAMSKSISDYTNSDYGVGITGKLNRIDKNNPFGDDNVVYFSIYDRKNDKYFDNDLKAIKASRMENKNLVIENITNELLSLLN